MTVITALIFQDCVKYESCRNKGLHAHHPRDCLFYLRDESVDDLQKLLNDNGVKYDIDPPKGQIDAETAKGIQAVEGLAGNTVWYCFKQCFKEPMPWRCV